MATSSRHTEPAGWGATKWGVLGGLVGGLVIAFGSFWQFIIVLFFTLLGFGVGWVLQNRVDVGEFFANRRR